MLCDEKALGHETAHGHEDALDATLTSLGLHKFLPPGPKPGGFIHVLQVLEERSRRRLADLSDVYAAPGGIDFGFAEHREFNAFAQRTSKDMICIYAATARTMWSWCNAVMSIREAFPWIDDIDRLGENSAPPPKGDLFFVREPSPTSEEIEPIRRKLAAALFDVAMDFALMHEVGHLWNGHVDLLHQQSGPRPFQEMRLIDAGGLELGEAQALEFDADSFAIQKVFARAYRENQFKEFSEGLLKDHRLPADGDHSATWFFTWFAIYGFFRLFDEACAAADIQRRPQAPAALRQACLLSTVAAVAQRQGWSSLTMPHWATLASSAGLEAEKATCRLRRVGLDAQSFLSAWEGPGFDQIEIYLQTWDALGPRLANLKRGPKPA
jgi:hypothetical protein